MIKKFKFKPCPFCGGTNIDLADGRNSRSIEGSHYCTVTCQSCYANISGDSFNGYVEEDLAEESAVNAWNKRSYNICEERKR